jgi:hypothetical protein
MVGVILGFGWTGRTRLIVGACAVAVGLVGLLFRGGWISLGWIGVGLFQLVRAYAARVEEEKPEVDELES